MYNFVVESYTTVKIDYSYIHEDETYKNHNINICKSSNMYKKY